MQGKNILLGITGGIAAYKSAELVRRLKEKGANIKVVMTRASKQFVTPLTFQALAGEPVYDDLWGPQAEAAMGHIALARWADVMVIAPASADFLARIATGLANDLLTTLILASKAPLYVVPAMNQQMWAHAATQTNIATLIQRGITMVGPASGSQACGDIGLGRMHEVEEIISVLENHFQPPLLKGVHLLITAGPTREYLDPVRYLSNASSGKMGYALAQAAAQAGGIVTLITGPTQLIPPCGIHVVQVETSQQMLDAVLHHIDEQNIFIAAAAVSDYRSEFVAAQKMAKTTDTLVLNFIRNPDILRTVTALPSPPFSVGFAAETHQLLHHARQKFKQKKCDLLIANQVGQKESGFNADNNAVTVLWAKGEQPWPLMPKIQLARELIIFIAEHYYAKYSTKNS